MLNVNGFGYRLFLETLGLRPAVPRALRRAAPGRARGTWRNHDGEAARWLWERSVPFDAIARRFADPPGGYSAVPHRFWIGAILFERDLWEAIGGLLVVPRGGLGHEEESSARSARGARARDRAARRARGALSFGPQDGG